MAGEYAKVNPNVEQVMFRPSAARVNAQIHYLHGQLADMRPAVAAELFASSIAALAYVILETNGIEETREIFRELVDEAYNQRKYTTETKGH